MPILSRQLWLACPLVLQAPLPWQKPSLVPSLDRVADSFATFLVRLGSPARDPEPRGKSPGWLPGRVRSRRIRYPTVRKGSKKPETSNSSQLNPQFDSASYFRWVNAFDRAILLLV
jgi:hypothetical protein